MYLPIDSIFTYDVKNLIVGVWGGGGLRGLGMKD
jgi:hypothetical protein